MPWLIVIFRNSLALRYIPGNGQGRKRFLVKTLGRLIVRKEYMLASILDIEGGFNYVEINLIIEAPSC